MHGKQESIGIKSLYDSFSLTEHISISVNRLTAYFLHKLFSWLMHKKYFLPSSQCKQSYFETVYCTDGLPAAVQLHPTESLCVLMVCM